MVKPLIFVYVFQKNNTIEVIEREEGVREGKKEEKRRKERRKKRKRRNKRQKVYI